MNYNLFDFLTLLGSLGLFLYGMKIMSEGIQKVAGEKLRGILSAMTSTRFMGVLTGFLVTSIVQSSSATTVMVVSFVNAGLLSLTQSIGVIMGANIGTTITAWLISLLGFKVKMAIISIPIIGIGFPMLFSKKDKWNSFGEFLIGFGLLFIGLDFLKSSVPDLQNSPELFASLQSLTQHGFLSTLIFVGIGTLLTIILQSSSAAMALTLVMCNNGWIPFEAGAAIVLGENIGTTVTANLAALIGNIHAKRAALAHTLFNLIGVAWMLVLFQVVLSLVNNYLLNAGSNSPYSDPASIPVALAIFHSTFNIANTFFLVWFVKWIEKTVIKLLPTKNAEDEKFHLEYIPSGLMNTPELNLIEAQKEMKQFVDITHRMFNFIPELMIEKDTKKFDDLLARIEKYENITDQMEIELASFLVKVASNEVSTETSMAIRGLLRASSNLEKIGDICYHMSLSINKKREEKEGFTPVQTKHLEHLFDLINSAFLAMKVNVNRDEGNIDLMDAISLEDQINKLRDKIRDEHFASIEKGEYSIKPGLYYNHIYSSSEKIADHILNVSEAISGKNIE